MKINKVALVSFRVLLAFSILLFVFCFASIAQEGASSAAASRIRYMADLGVMPASREVSVEDFVNYHRHQIGRPRVGEAVAMDVRWGNDQVSGADDEAILQIGFSTPLVNDRHQLPPLNLGLVIDRSGSMADDDKMTRVKASLLALVSQMRDSDVISITVFDSRAQVLLPASRLTDRDYVNRLIRSIQPGGATNLYAGLMLGYNEVEKNYRKGITNRVILLTDGIANQGVTDPTEIAHDSLQFNNAGIDLSTIGVGLDLNRDLLSLLAKSGRGLFHFVAQSEDIQKVFVNEFQSLTSPVAEEPNVEIDFGKGLELEQVYGYSPHFRESGITIKLDNMNNGLTQVILLRFRVERQRRESSSLPVRVQFSYRDVDRNAQVVRGEEALLTINRQAGDMMDLL